MPIVVVRNWPSKVANVEWQGKIKSEGWPDPRELVMWISDDNSFKRDFGKELREAVVSANVPGVDSVNQVTVSFDDGQMLEESPWLVIEVIGLFERSDRTKEVRDRLARSLLERVKAWNGSWSAEVHVHRFDSEVDSYIKG